MVNPSLNVIDRDLNDLREVVGGGSSLGGINNISNLRESTVSSNLGDGHISYNCYSAHQIFINILRVFHQNIRSSKYKTDELLSDLHPDFQYILCLTEHHMYK
jgi:hypothetical protein